MNSCLGCIHGHLCQKRGEPCDDYVNAAVVSGELAHLCLFNDGILCYMHNECPKCGWNPVVVNARKKELRRQAAHGEHLHVQV